MTAYGVRWPRLTFGRTTALQTWALAVLIALIVAGGPATAQSPGRASEFKLPNGMQVVVIPDTRAPVVTHLVIYRTGSADEPRGVSGIAHFLEHLLFKSTATREVEFSKIVAKLGGNDNAFTNQDVTGYYQRIAKDRLAQMMALEADRMVNLRLDEKEVATEREVIIEERRTRVENVPSELLEEQMSAVLFQSHPYRIPVIGWMHEMQKLSREDAFAFYKRYYAPNNAVLVVAGDVTPDEVKTLAMETYGKVPLNPAVTPRTRVKEPPPRAPRRLDLIDARAGRPMWQRHYLVPAYPTAKPGEAEAIELLLKIVGGGNTSRLYQRLVVDEKVAASASANYSGNSLDYGRLQLTVVPADGVAPAVLEARIDAVLADIREKGVTPAELERARKSMIAEFTYASDNQFTLAQWYGFLLGVGESVQRIEAWPGAVAKATIEQVNAAAREHLDMRQSVTGLLLPDAAAIAGGAPAPNKP